MTPDRDQPPALRPAITIRATYRQLGAGPEEIEVQWDSGARLPDADELCDVVHALIGHERINIQGGN